MFLSRRSMKEQFHGDFIGFPGAMFGTTRSTTLGIKPALV